MSLNRVIKRLKIEMSGSTKQYQVSAKQSDRATRYVEIQLLDQGAEYEIPPGSNVTAYVKKPDLKRVYSPCTFSGSVVTMELTSQTLAAAGTALAEIEVKSGDMTEVITSCTFEIKIEPCVKDEDAIISGDEMSLFDATMKAYAEAEAARVTAENARVEAENARQENATIVLQSLSSENASAKSNLEELRSENFNSQEILSGVADLRAYLGLADSDVVGLQCDWKNSTFTRLAAAKGLNAGSDFDQFTPFGGRKRCNLADDGTVLAWYGEDGYRDA